MKEFIRQQFTAGQKIKRLFLLVPKHWQISVSVAVGTITFYVLTVTVEKNVMLAQNSTIINAASIITAILITYLVGKVIQMRQEKLALWPEYLKVAKEANHCRGAFLPLLQSWNFWPQGMKYEMENAYKQLRYYDVRKIVFVYATPLTPLAQQFINHETGPKNLYLQLRELFGSDLVLESVRLDSEYEIWLDYPIVKLDLWLTFDVGHGIWLYLKDQYVNYRTQFNFAALSPTEIQRIEKHSRQLDGGRFQGRPVANDLMGDIGSYFTERVLPGLYRLELVLENSRPEPVIQLIRVMQWMIITGIIIPLFVALDWLPVACSMFAAACLVAILIYTAIMLEAVLLKELKVEQRNLPLS